ncbi:flavin reductase family protein [Nocardia sp. NPDC059239]|uniref:flavin reductase family protein n=1 Tax=unclassified Nocardia TaxID=2637762 RepID=UPI0036A31F3F
MSASTAASALPDGFREAMSSFPSGVTIVTTTDADGQWWGFTATSFCSVSMDPPLVLVCLADTAQCHAAFQSAQRWSIHVIGGSHADLALRFATRGEDKFANAGFVAGEENIPVLGDVPVRLDCVEHTKVVAGDHTVLVGQVIGTDMSDSSPTVYFRRAFHPLE